MNISGILVCVLPTQIETMSTAINELPGFEVYAKDSSGRLIVVQEAATIDEEIAGLRRLKSMPNVITADLLYHYFGEDQDITRFPDIAPNCQTGSRSCAPAVLNE